MLGSPGEMAGGVAGAEAHGLPALRQGDDESTGPAGDGAHLGGNRPSPCGSETYAVACITVGLECGLLLGLGSLTSANDVATVVLDDFAFSKHWRCRGPSSGMVGHLSDNRRSPKRVPALEQT